ncbi:MAG: hypothetical protein ACUZ8H_01775 [Candidatus Anammoxibacter sp.]
MRSLLAWMITYRAIYNDNIILEDKYYMKRDELENKVKNLRLGSKEYTQEHPARAVAKDIMHDPCSKFYDDSQEINLASIVLNIEKLQSQKDSVMDIVIGKLGVNHKLTVLVSLAFEDVC